MKKCWLPAFDSTALGHLVIASNLQRFLIARGRHRHAQSLAEIYTINPDGLGLRS
jgi:hypothetical protein